MDERRYFFIPNVQRFCYAGTQLTFPAVNPTGPTAGLLYKSWGLGLQAEWSDEQDAFLADCITAYKWVATTLQVIAGKAYIAVES